MAKSAVIRIFKEIEEIRSGDNLSLAVAFQEDNIRKVKALIIGPPGTPYEFGFFEFHLKFGDKYPTEAPNVKSITTYGGRCRFNPNIYANGKVCLSILGTWRGEKGEEWSTVQNLESVLISIQSLLSSNPFQNEPAFEDTEASDRKAQEYAAKIRHETLRITVVQRLETLLHISVKDSGDPEYRKRAAANNPDGQPASAATSSDDDDDEALRSLEPFADLFKRRFLWYHDAYIAAITDAETRNADGTKFMLAPFEYGQNKMIGKYNYTSLRRRLERIRVALNDELTKWTTDGLLAVRAGNSIAANLSRQFEQCCQHFNTRPGSTCELTLIDDNPFLWNLTFFGKTETDLYGATINVRIYFSTKFPEEQPRARVLTKLFHHRISKTGGFLCYFPEKPQDVRAHVEAIMLAIEDEDPRYDPRTLVNPDAAALLWGDEQQKKQYRRTLRRTVQDSMDVVDDY